MSWILEYFVVYLSCVYIYVRLVMSSYLLFCCIYFDAWCITCCPKREETLEVYRVIAYMYVRLVMPSYLLFCCIYFDAWCITWCLKREETLKVYTVIGEEVLVLSLLVVMYKISN